MGVAEAFEPFGWTAGTGYPIAKRPDEFDRLTVQNLPLLNQTDQALRILRTLDH